MSTRSLVVFSEDEGLRLKTRESVFIYIHHDGYCRYRLNELFEYIKDNGLPYDVPYDSRCFVNWMYDNADESVGIETNFTNLSLRKYCRGYIEFIYKLTPHSVIIYNMYLDPLYKINFEDKNNSCKCWPKNYDSELIKHYEWTNGRLDDEELPEDLKILYDNFVHMERRIADTNFEDDKKHSYKCYEIDYLDLI